MLFARCQLEIQRWVPWRRRVCQSNIRQMKRLLTGLVLLAACSGSVSGPRPSTGPGPLARLTVAADAANLYVGQTTAVIPSPTDAKGAPITGLTTTYLSSTPAVATVDAGGTVTTIAAGTTTITATVGTFAAQVTLTVAAAPPACSTTGTIAISAGEVRTLSGNDRAFPCLTGGTAGAEYALVAFNSDTSGVNRPVSLTATNTAVATGAPSVVAPFPASLRVAPDGDFEQALRANERRALSPRFRALKTGGASTARQAVARSALRAPSFIRGLAASPALGTLIRLNSNGVGLGTDPCATNASDYHFARVVAVTTNTIVVADTGAPSGGFTDAEMTSIGTTFDTLVFATDTTAFGAPYDSDSNGRVLLFFTHAVNKLTARNGNTVVGGFFTSRDLFPTTSTNPSNVCSGSNEGEMFYLPVLDVAGTFNTAYTNRTALKARTIAVLGHEFQHVINASRRLFLTDADDFESIWLDEGMSHLAEELVFYRSSGLQPKSDLDWPQLTSSAAIATAFNTFQYDNMQRLGEFLARPSTFSSYANNDSLATRGAAWALLRYLLDQSPNAPSSYLHLMVNSSRHGIAELNGVFGDVVPNAVTGAQQLAVTLFTDNGVAGVNSTFTMKSWNARSIMPNIAGSGATYPLRVQALTSGAAISSSLTYGGSAYFRFKVNSGGVASIISRSGSNALHGVINLMLVRTQ